MSISVSEFFLPASRPPGPGPRGAFALFLPRLQQSELPLLHRSCSPRPEGQGCRGRSPSAGFWPPAFPWDWGRALVFTFFTRQHGIQDKLWLTVSAKGEGFPVCSWALGLFPERGICCPLHCHHHTPRSSPDGWPVLDAGCSAVKRWRGRRQAAGTLWGSRVLSPVGEALSLPVAPTAPASYISHREPFLRHSFQPSPAPRPCASIASFTEWEGCGPPSTGLIKERHLCSQVVVLFF